MPDLPTFSILCIYLAQVQKSLFLTHIYFWFFFPQETAV